MTREEYHAYLRSDSWAAIRRMAIEYAGGRCHVCNTERRLEVHHRTYERVGRESLFDLAVLCRACHLKHHGNLAKPPSSNGLLEAPLPHKTVDPTRVALKQAIYDAETEEEKREALQRFQEHVSTTREASGDG